MFGVVGVGGLDGIVDHFLGDGGFLEVGGGRGEGEEVVEGLLSAVVDGFARFGATFFPEERYGGGGVIGGEFALGGFGDARGGSPFFGASVGLDSSSGDGVISGYFGVWFT